MRNVIEGRIEGRGNLSEPWVCGLCDRAVFSHFLEKGGYHIARCSSCSLVQVFPRPLPGTMAIFYDTNGLRTSEFSSYVLGEDSHRKLASNYLAFMDRYVSPPGKLLEVGAAAGFFLDAARHRGWEVQGIEISTKFTTYARERFNLAMTPDLTRSNILPGSLDVVVLWGVLEHLLDPREDVRELSRLLRRGAWLFLITENIESRSARLFGKRWFWFLPPEHLYHFTPRTVRSLLEVAGLELVGLSPLRCSIRTVFLSFFGEKGFSLRQRAAARLRREQDARRAGETGRGIWFRVIDAALRIGKDFLNCEIPGLDDRMLVVARRR